jgi:3-hydroxyisobutyrate dehydrogenase-like beta-hydroxyacid dehydrogenase
MQAGFIGLGAMGQHMARNLHRAAFSPAPGTVRRQG